MIVAAPMRISVVGPVAGGSRSVALCAVRALRRLGHEVRFVDNARFSPGLEAIRAAPDAPAMKDAMVAELMKLAAAATREELVATRPEVALYLAQAPVLSEDDTAPVRAAGTLAIFWFVEDRRVFPYWARTARRFDVFWGIQEGTFPAELAAVGQPRFAFVPLCCDPELHRPLPDGAGRADPIAFVGSAWPNRLRTLAALADLDLRLYGPGFSREPALAPRIAHDGPLPHEELPRIFSGARINLNLSSSTANADWTAPKDFVNPRAFEIAGCGGFQLAEALLPVARFFEPGVEIVTFATPDEAREAIARALADEAWRRAIAERGHRRALGDHTYDRRLAEALANVPAWRGR